MSRKSHIVAYLTILLTLPIGKGFAHEVIGQAEPTDVDAAQKAPAVQAVQSAVVSPLDHPIPVRALERLRQAPRAIYISKSYRTLTLLEHGKRVRTYPVAIGKTPDGAKQRLGDGKTPEGLYYIAGHHPGSRFHKALKISYPNVEDARRGLEQGLITARQARAIKTAHSAKALPPQNTRLGRYIEIHGGYQLARTGPGERPWIYASTDGCIAVTNEMIEEIYDWTPSGAPVLIQA